MRSFIFTVVPVVGACTTGSGAILVSVLFVVALVASVVSVALKNALCCHCVETDLSTYLVCWCWCS